MPLACRASNCSVARTASRSRHLPCAGAAAHDLVRLLHDQLAARLALSLAIGGILALSLVIAHVHELWVVVAVCLPERHPAGAGERGTGERRAGSGGGVVSWMLPVFTIELPWCILLVLPVSVIIDSDTSAVSRNFLLVKTNYCT